MHSISAFEALGGGFLHSHGRKPPRECAESTSFARMQPISGMQGAAELSRGASVRDVGAVRDR